MRLKEAPLNKYAKQHNKTITILGIRNDEGGRRSINKGCLSGTKNITFSPLKVVSDEWEEEFIKRENIELCELYKPPYNFKRTGCKGCPFNEKVQNELLTMKKMLPKEYKQCLHIWKPVYDEYARIGYRLDKSFYDKVIQLTIDDFLD